MGDGTYSICAKCINRDTAKAYAVKISFLKYDIASETESLTACQGHENIVKLIDVQKDNVYSYIVMELLDGGELLTRARLKPFNAAALSQIIVQLISAVEFMHKKNIVHRDIKPENILFVTDRTTDFRVKIVDFGFATTDHSDGMKKSCFTLDYAAPEILMSNGKNSYTKACDLWSLGATLYTISTRSLPFRTEYLDSRDRDIDAIVERIKSGAFERKTDAWKTLNPHIRVLIRGLLVVDPEHRKTLIDIYEKDLQWIRATGRREELSSAGSECESETDQPDESESEKQQQEESQHKPVINEISSESCESKSSSGIVTSEPNNRSSDSNFDGKCDASSTVDSSKQNIILDGDSGDNSMSSKDSKKTLKFVGPSSSVDNNNFANKILAMSPRYIDDMYEEPEQTQEEIERLIAAAMDDGVDDGIDYDENYMLHCSPTPSGENYPPNEHLYSAEEEEEELERCRDLGLPEATLPFKGFLQMHIVRRKTVSCDSEEFIGFDDDVDDIAIRQKQERMLKNTFLGFHWDDIEDNVKEKIEEINKQIHLNCSRQSNNQALIPVHSRHSNRRQTKDFIGFRRPHPIAIAKYLKLINRLVANRGNRFSRILSKKCQPQQRRRRGLTVKPTTKIVRNLSVDDQNRHSPNRLKRKIENCDYQSLSISSTNIVALSKRRKIVKSSPLSLMSTSLSKPSRPSSTQSLFPMNLETKENHFTTKAIKLEKSKISSKQQLQNGSTRKKLRSGTKF